MTTAVIGAGIAGLAAARALHDEDVVVLEASDRVGGKLRTGGLGEEGADSFLATQPEAAALARELGLDLVAPAASGVRVWWDGRLHDLPEGLVLGVPTGLLPLLRSRLLSPAGVLRAAGDLVLPRTGGATVAEVVGRRFGNEVVERLVDPLLAGVYAGRVDVLDAALATPQLAEAAARSRSLLLGLRRRAPVPGPLFLTVRDGMQRLPEAIAAGLDVRTDWPVERLERRDAGWRVHGREALDVDRVIVATPAFTAATLHPTLAPLAGVPYASVALVTLVHPRGAGDLRGSGMLVPSTAGRLVKAATWVSAKWPHRAADDVAIVRASVGRAGDTVARDTGDATLIARVGAELHEAVGLPRTPLEAQVTRWFDALPQYEVGHAGRIAAIEAALPPGLALAGAYLRGVGIPACIRSGYEAARSIR